MRFAPLLLVCAATVPACDVTGAGPGSNTNTAADAGAINAGDVISYRDLAAHPGCSTAGLTYTPATIAGYDCAAKLYPFPAGASEDTARPIVVLVHGNSDTPAGFERFPADGEVDQLAERLPALGFRSYAIDLRIDLVDDPQGDNESENAARNIDHGWAVPIVQQLIVALLDANPGRRLSLVGFSLGVTVVRDALRRLHASHGAQVWSRIADVIGLAGANHGVSSCALCSSNPTMRGRVTCEMGCRDNYSPTPFLTALNGPGGIYETPCANGSTAYGTADACGGNRVSYTTIVMRDIEDGTYQDLFVSEASARLVGADNQLIRLEDVDPTGYFFDGLFKNHYGSARSPAALDLIAARLGD